MTSQTTFTSCMHDQMLESNRDDVKLEAMRCVTVMTAKGKLSVPRSLFPHIVKNVSSKNPELKKMIYLYLTNFADQEPDLALLPIATLQKSLKSPNPLVRSNALKVLTSMRLSILSAILIATIRNSVNDLSPYVRKTVAHSIIKLYRLDPSLSEDLLEYIERLFNDKNSMVLSSAVATFNIVCPEKYELIQKHYRRFCFLLADCNEWGQAVLVDLLKRYIVKTHEMVKDGTLKEINTTDHDPRVLLRSAKPLLHSNNAAVVMSVVNLYITIANHTEVRSTITRPLIRLLYSHREIQMQVLEMIEALTTFKGNVNDNHEGDEDDDDDNGRLEDSPSQVQVSLIKDDTGNKSATSIVAASTSDGSSSPDSVSPETDTQAKTSQQATEQEPDEQEVAVADDQKQPLTKDGYIPLDYGDSPKPEPEQAGSPPGENDEGVQLESVNGASATTTKTDTNEPIEKSQTNKSGDDDDNSAEDDEADEEGEDDEGEEEDEDSSEEDDGSDEDDSESDSDTETESSSSGEELDKNGGPISSKSDDAIKVGMDFELNPMKDPSAYREVFRPYIKSFFVKHNDCTQIRLAKLRILTNLSSPVNVSQVLRELQAYISSYVDDKEFVSASIHSIGRCAILVKEVAHTCLNGLTSLLSNNNEHIVAEAIVVLRSQIIDKKVTTKPAAVTGDTHLSNDNNISDNGYHASSVAKDDDNTTLASQPPADAEEDVKIVSTVIKQVTKLLPSVTAPQARATILWILAEFCQTNLTAAKCAPEVLRSIAKSFCQEDNFVKLQSLTLAAKFLLSLDKDKKPELYHTIQLLTGYLFSLAKYDLNHDVRDRGRFLKKLLEDEQICAKVLNCAC